MPIEALESRAARLGNDAPPLPLRHVVESQQFTVPLLMDLFDRTRHMERIVARGGTLDYQGRILASIFYEPSTRTRLCFEAAMLDSLDEVFQLLTLGFAEQGDGCAFDGGIAGLNDFC